MVIFNHILNWSQKNCHWQPKATPSIQVHFGGMSNFSGVTVKLLLVLTGGAHRCSGVRGGGSGRGLSTATRHYGVQYATVVEKYFYVHVANRSSCISVSIIRRGETFLFCSPLKKIFLELISKCSFFIHLYHILSSRQPLAPSTGDTNIVNKVMFKDLVSWMDNRLLSRF